MIDGAMHLLAPGSALVIPGNVPHSYGPNDTSWSFWWCTLLGTDVDDLIDEAGVTMRSPVIRVRHPERIVALLDEIVTDYELRPTRARVLDAAGNAWRLLTYLGLDREAAAPEDPLSRAMDYLVERLDSEIRVADLAALVGVSSARLTTLFRQATGGGVLAHLVRLRMMEARRMLRDTDASVKEVARAVGYQDPFYFSRHFRRVHGKSPSAFRDELPASSARI